MLNAFYKYGNFESMLGIEFRVRLTKIFSNFEKNKILEIYFLNNSENLKNEEKEFLNSLIKFLENFHTIEKKYQNKKIKNKKFISEKISEIEFWEFNNFSNDYEKEILEIFSVKIPKNKFLERMKNCNGIILIFPKNKNFEIEFFEKNNFKNISEKIKNKNIWIISKLIF